jgi:hypothetical protein
LADDEAKAGVELGRSVLDEREREPARRAKARVKMLRSRMAVLKVGGMID